MRWIDMSTGGKEQIVWAQGQPDIASTDGCVYMIFGNPTDEYGEWKHGSFDDNYCYTMRNLKSPGRSIQAYACGKPPS
ncbi:unnamed protein product [Caenorhabditis bovis]|uniref:Uncharacterized protein n=1 Tax=Caenorhabditis bovis TaxID=2654633 RepID=A0A8S1EQY6_9PELO|nr:unnamed protein product [Caenorhabditis bovis]